MKRRITIIAIFLITIKSVTAQLSHVDSLKNEISRSKNDTINLLLSEKLSNIYSEINPDSSWYYANKMLALTQKHNLRLEEVSALGEMGYALINMGNYPRSLQTLLSAISIAKDTKSEQNVLPGKFPITDDFTDRSQSAHKQRLTKLARVMQYAGILYTNSGNYEKAIYYYNEAIPLAEQANNLGLRGISYSTLGRVYLSLNKTDSALLCQQQAYDDVTKAGYERYLGSILLNMGRVYLSLGEEKKAKEYFIMALIKSTEHHYFRGIVASNLALADIYKQSGKKDSSLYHIKNGLQTAYTLNAPDLLLRSYTALAEYYIKTGYNDSTVKYQSLIIKINDSLFNSKQVQQFQNIDFDAQQQQIAIQAAKKEYNDRMQKYLLLGGLAVFLFVAVFFWRSNLHRQKSNIILQKQNKEIEIALANLRSTQSQLVQSEKMASLGELTAGIAHEIQNPLNFVNNFSELNTELIEELKGEKRKPEGERNPQLEEDLLNDLSDNLKKINLHGKRADAIVKGMLQHSRSSTGVKEPTDINALADEYLRLSYHGLRAKDKSFNATFKTDFDETIGNINIIPQDIGRVLLNLYNNAFYAAPLPPPEKVGINSGGFPDPNYVHNPTVWVSTKKMGDKVLIIVKDNGPGIPQKILDKIFQPFFTTKPAGQGTGLGLSLSYDIVKAHGGEIKVETSEGEGSAFIILLPV